MIGDRIVKLRKSLNIERKELARGIVSYSHLSKIESGSVECSKDIMISIARRLNVPEEYLLNYKEIDNNLEILLNSLKENIDNLKEEKAKVNLLKIKKDYQYIHSIDQESFFYLLDSYYYLVIKEADNGIKIFENELLPLLNNINIKNLSNKFEETYYYVQGTINYYKDNFKLSYEFYKKQLPLLKSNFMKARINYNIALNLYKLNDICDSISYAKEALELHLIERNWAKIAETDNLLGVLYRDSKQLDLARKSLTNSLELVEKNDLSYLKPKILHNLGSIYQLNKNFHEAINLFTQSLNLKKQTNIDIFVTYKHILEIHLESNSLDKFNLILDEAIKVCNTQNELSQLKIIEAKFYYNKGNFTEYEKLMKESIDYLYNNNYWYNLRGYIEDFAKYYLNKGKYKNASYYLNLTVELYNNN